MSAYANIARALGAEVRGWDLRDTIFMGSLDGIEVDLGGEPAPPAGWEVVVSTAHLHRIEGIAAGRLPRGARRRAAGDRGRRRPRQDDDRGDDRLRAAARPGAIRPGSSAASSRSSAGTPASGTAGSSSRATSPTARSARCARRSPSSRTSSSTTTRRTHPRRSCARSSTTGSRAVPQVVRSWELPPVELELAVPGDHNRQNAAAALAALELAGVAARRGRGRDRRGSPESGGGSSSSASGAASRSTTTTATTRPSSR